MTQSAPFPVEGHYYIISIRTRLWFNLTSDLKQMLMGQVVSGVQFKYEHMIDACLPPAVSVDACKTEELFNFLPLTRVNDSTSNPAHELQCVSVCPYLTGRGILLTGSLLCRFGSSAKHQNDLSPQLLMTKTNQETARSIPSRTARSTNK